MDIKTPKDKYLRRKIYAENVIYARWNGMKNCAKKKMVINIGKRSKKLSQSKAEIRILKVFKGQVT